MSKRNFFKSPAPPPYRDGGAKTATMRHQSTPQMTALKAAAATVRHHLTGTPINPAEFEIKTQTLASGKSRIMCNIGHRRAWAMGKEMFDLVRAFDQLIKICEQ